MSGRGEERALERIQSENALRDFARVVHGFYLAMDGTKTENDVILWVRDYIDRAENGTYPAIDVARLIRDEERGVARATS
jgi:hypothetical protein